MVVLHCSTGTVVSDTYKDDGDYPLFLESQHRVPASAHITLVLT